MGKRFDHKEIEKKWQKTWKESGFYDVSVRDTSKEKKYILVEFPYPSGNLHIGHWFAFAVLDIYVRALRMQGKQVFFPIGFDSFGLPAENAAIQRNLNPKDWTYDNIAKMTEQLESMGNAFSWNAMLRTSDPEYYKWTQWMFTQFFEKDIAYRGVGTVNWCPSCNTVLANEQVLDGACERCGSTVEQKVMNQWMMRITKYADRLIDDLDALDWPESIKDSQRNWIGRSEGAEIDFILSTGDTATVFTTRADTLYGATYLVLAPEHALVAKLKNTIENWSDVEVYQKATSAKKNIERLAESKDKTGVKLEGITASNPANGEQIPVFIADYVLATYGTGAIMAVPSHDERDSAFADIFALAKIKVIESEIDTYTGEGILKNSGEFTGMLSYEAKEKIATKVGGRIAKKYKLRDWSVGRQRYWGVPIPIVYDPEGKPHVVPKEHLPWLLPEDVDVKPTGEPPLAKSKELKERTEKIFGAGWTPEVETLDTFVDSSWHFLRFTDNHNTEEFASKVAQADWLPVDVYFGGAEHTTMHLLYSRFWQKVLFDLGLTTVDEPYQGRINRGLVLGTDGNKMSKSKGNVIDPDEQVERLGADTVKMYLAFMGPYAQPSNYPWDLGGIAGIRRFLERVYALSDVTFTDITPESTAQLLHQTIEKVTADIALYKFNTALSALMIFLNEVEKTSLAKSDYELFLRMLAPFAPHLSEETWYALGHTGSVHTEAWPVPDTSRAQKNTFTIGVQVNGKVRGLITLPRDASEDDAMKLIEKIANIQKYIGGQKPSKVIYVQNKIINLIIG